MYYYESKLYALPIRGCKFSALLELLLILYELLLFDYSPREDVLKGSLVLEPSSQLSPLVSN